VPETDAYFGLEIRKRNIGFTAIILTGISFTSFYGVGMSHVNLNSSMPGHFSPISLSVSTRLKSVPQRSDNRNNIKLHYHFFSPPQACWSRKRAKNIYSLTLGVTSRAKRGFIFFPFLLFFEREKEVCYLDITPQNFCHKGALTTIGGVIVFGCDRLVYD